MRLTTLDASDQFLTSESRGNLMVDFELGMLNAPDMSEPCYRAGTVERRPMILMMKVATTKNVDVANFFHRQSFLPKVDRRRPSVAGAERRQSPVVTTDADLP